MPFEMAELHTKIKELNDLAGDGCFDVVKNTRGAHLLAPDPVVLIVYADGLKLHTHKFCKYEEKVCKSLVADIMDGARSAPAVDMSCARHAVESNAGLPRAPSLKGFCNNRQAEAHCGSPQVTSLQR